LGCGRSQTTSGNAQLGECETYFGPALDGHNGSHVGFGIRREDDHASQLQANLNACIESELPDLHKIAKLRDAELHQLKQTYAEHFQITIDFFKSRPLTESLFTEIWSGGLTQRIGSGRRRLTGVST